METRTETEARSNAHDGQNAVLPVAEASLQANRAPEEVKREEQAEAPPSQLEQAQHKQYEPIAPQNYIGHPSGWQNSSQMLGPQARGHAMRTGLKDTMSPGSAESSQYAVRPAQLPMVESRQEADFLMSLASPTSMTPRNAAQHAQLYHHGLALAQEGAAGMARLAPRQLYPEEEGLYGHREPRFLRASEMQPPLAMPGERRGAMHMAGSPRRAMGGMPSHPHAMDGSPHAMAQHGADELRDMARVPESPMTPTGNNLQRSASEGFMRGSSAHMGMHHRTGSAGAGLHDERGARLAAEQGLLAPRGGDSPDFAMIYAFLGSMFDPVCHMINHHDVLTQMCDMDRETSVLLLSNISANLDAHGQEIFGRYLNSALQAQPSRRSRDTQ